MKWHQIRSYIATFALLAAVLSVRQLCAEQKPLDQAADLLSKGSIAEAVTILRQLVASDAGNADSRLLLGTALALKGNRTESIEQMAEAVRLRPQSASAHNQYGTVLSRFIEVEAARHEFEKALELDPQLSEAHVNLALMLAQASELIAAAAHLDRAIELQGDTGVAAYTHFLRAKIWAAQNQVDKAMLELQKAVQLRPEYAEAWSDLGGLRRLSLDQKGAVQALEKAVALNPDDVTAQYRLGQQYLQNGDAGKAIEHFKRADPGDVATLYNLDRALRKAGKREDAEPIERKITELRERSNRASSVALAASRLNDEGIALEKSGDIWTALTKYRAALDLDPTGFGFELNYGLALCRIGRWEDGATELREVLRLDPDNAVAAKALYIADERVARPPRPN